MVEMLCCGEVKTSRKIQQKIVHRIRRCTIFLIIRIDYSVIIPRVRPHILALKGVGGGIRYRSAVQPLCCGRPRYCQTLLSSPCFQVVEQTKVSIRR